MTLRKEEFGRHNILPHPPDVLPGKGGGLDLHGFFIFFHDIFDHDDRISVAGKYLACVYIKGVFPDYELSRAVHGGAERALRPDGYPVHRSAMKLRRGKAGRNRSRCNSRDTFRRSKDFIRENPPGRDSLKEYLSRLLKRLHLKINITFHSSVSV